METKEQIRRMVGDLETKRQLCGAKCSLLNSFKRDVTESFTECRTAVKRTFLAMANHLAQQQDEILQELEQGLKHNLEALQHEAAPLEHTQLRIEQQMEEGKSLLQEHDAFTFFAKGALYRQLSPISIPGVYPKFVDTFPDLSSVSIEAFQIPLQHCVCMDMREFLSSGAPSRICGNIFHGGFRFQLQLKCADRFLSAYLCLRAWHEVSPFLRVSVNFTLSLHDGPALLHEATAKNTFEGQNDGWGWNKFISLEKLRDCTEVLFTVTFKELVYEFIQEEELKARYASNEPTNDGASQFQVYAPYSLLQEKHEMFSKRENMNQ